MSVRDCEDHRPRASSCSVVAAREQVRGCSVVSVALDTSARGDIFALRDVGFLEAELGQCLFWLPLLLVRFQFGEATVESVAVEC